MSHLVDPDLVPALALVPDLDSLSDATLPAIRASLIAPPVALGSDGIVTVTRVEISDHAGALVYTPDKPRAGPRPALLNIHGGGFVAGSITREDATMRELATRLDCVVVSAEYRLAPEHPYPAALDDCHAALLWIMREADALKIDPACVGVRGVSAGGGIALGLGLCARDRKSAPIAFLHLVYPMLDDRTGAHPFTGRHVWTAAANRYGWDAILNGQDRANPSPYAVPARAGDLAGLPPVFLAVGSIDLFAGEDLALASRLIDAGVPVELHLYPGAYHGFIQVTGTRPAAAFARDSLAALDRAMNDIKEK